MNLERIGEDCTLLIKKQPWFPFMTGNLKYHATSGKMSSNDIYVITFDSKIAPYVAALEEGSKPHDILNAFGFADPNSKRFKRLDFGIGGKFDGKFHPGSNKHKGFISDTSVNTIVKYICAKYNGEIK